MDSLSFILRKYSFYGFWGSIRIAIEVIHTKIMIPSARLIRRPIDVRGARHIDWGKNLTMGRYCRVEAIPDSPAGVLKIIRFGNSVEINDLVHIVGMESVTIGNNVLIASKVFISDCSHGLYGGKDNEESSPACPPGRRKLYSAPVEIGDNVWIGEGVTILLGAKIGSGSIIGAGSLVSKEIPADCIAIGIPARVVKKYNRETSRWEKNG